MADKLTTDGTDESAEVKDKKKATKYNPAVIGQTGLNHGGSGWVNEEFLTELRGMNGRRVYGEMADNCPVSGAIIYALSSLFRGVNLSVQAVDDSDKAEEAATFLEEVLFDMDTSVDAVLAEVATMFVYGFAPMEILFKRRVGPYETDPTRKSRYSDNKYGLRGLVLRGQRTIHRWQIDDATGEILGMYQQPWTGHEIFIPSGKMLLFRTTPALNNPEGRSLLRNAYRPWYFKRRIEEIEAVGIERDLAGLPLVRIPSEYMDADADPDMIAVYSAYKSMAKGIRHDTHEGIVLPSDTKDGKFLFDITLMSTGGSRAIDPSKSLDRYDRQIAMSVLADFIFLGQSSVGSFALSSDKTALFSQALGGFLKLVVGELNTKLVPAIWMLNGLDPELMPTITHDDIEKPDLGVLGAFLGSMTSAGAQLFPDRELENRLRELAGMPPAPEEGSEEAALQAGNQPGVPGQEQPGQEAQPGQQPGQMQPQPGAQPSNMAEQPQNLPADGQNPLGLPGDEEKAPEPAPEPENKAPEPEPKSEPDGDKADDEETTKRRNRLMEVLGGLGSSILKRNRAV